MNMINITNATILDEIEKNDNKYGILILGTIIFAASLCLICQIATWMKKKGKSSCECRCRI